MMIQTILVYIGLVVVLMYLFRKSATTYKTSLTISNFWYLMALLTFAIIFGMRYYVGIDYYAYKDVYESPDYRMLRYEPGFLLITMICQQYEFHYAIYFTILAFIQILFMTLAFKREREILPFLFLVLLFSGNIILGWMNGIRQYLAICICVYAVACLVQGKIKNLITFYLLVILASTMHLTALIMLFFPLLTIRKKELFTKKRIQYILLILFFIIQLFNVKSILFSYIENLAALLGYDNYADKISSSTSAAYGITDIITLCIYILMISSSGRVKKFYNSHKFNLIYDVAFIGILLNYFFAGSMMLQRINLYIYIFIYPLFAYYLNYFYTDKKSLWCRQRYYAVIFYFVLLFTRIMMSMTTNTAQFVFYFQENLHPLKEQQMLINQLNDIN